MNKIYLIGMTLIMSLFIVVKAEDNFDNWFHAVSEDGNYSIMFPETPIYSFYPEFGNELKGKLYTHELTKLPFGIYFSVQCLKYKGDETPLERLEYTINNFKKHYKDSSFVFRDSITHDQFEHKGVEYSGYRIKSSIIKKKDILGVVRFFYTDDCLYTIEVVGDDDIQLSSTPSKFFNSFKLLNKK